MQSECPVSLEKGLVLSFEVRANPTKGDGHWRTHNASEVLVGQLMPATGGLIPGFHTVPGANELVVHVGAMNLDAHRKVVPDEDVALVVSNRPLAGIPGDGDGIEIPIDEGQVLAGMERYMFGLFPQLHSVGITFEVVGFDEDAQDALIAEHIELLRGMDMAGQAASLDSLYRQFKATRQTLVWIIERGLFSTGTPMSPVILTSIIEMVQSRKSPEEKVQGAEAVQATVDWMLERNLLRANTALPMKVLPDLFAACPVWFLAAGEEEMGAGRAQVNSDDPRIQPATKFFCGQFPKSTPWWDTYQMFNRRMRPIETYEGDQIPMHVLRLIPQAREVFDYVVIATPYHDIAGRDWKDLSWVRSLDPYLIGFKKGLPFFFVLARWTDGGIFPGHIELVADTLNFLREKKDSLTGFNSVSQPYWGQPGNPGACAQRLGDRLVKNVDDLLRAAAMGHLFEWLRGEWKLPEASLASNVPAPTGPTGVAAP